MGYGRVGQIGKQWPHGEDNDLILAMEEIRIPSVVLPTFAKKQLQS